MPGSNAGSVGSLGSRSAFPPGKPSFVDESLFGGKKEEKPSQQSQTASPGRTTLPSLGRRTKPNAETSEAVTLKRTDIERMLKASPIMSADDLARTKKELQTRREEAQAVSKARKEKMLRLEEEAKKKRPETETERLRAATNKKLLSRADQLLEEEKDEVKHMNKMMLYSKCVTIRDAQIEQKKQMMLETEDEGRRQDLMMEIERIKAMEQYELRETQRKEEQFRGARVLESQIAERERERIRQEELRDQERIMMLREAERLKEEELQQTIEKKLQAQSLMADVAAANSEQIRQKELARLREKEEDARIVEYIRARDAREQELIAEKERIAREREMETARLRAMQERAADKQAELDELRARRYQESKDREWRAHERALAEQHAMLQAELANAREAQKAASLLQKAEMAKVEHDEFMRVLAVNHAKELEDMQAQANALSINNRYKEELLAQIASNEERKKKERQVYLEEGKKIREAAEAEKVRLAAIKSRKLDELQISGVPSKYQAELEKYKIRVR